MKAPKSGEQINECILLFIIFHHYQLNLWDLLEEFLQFLKRDGLKDITVELYRQFCIKFLLTDFADQGSWLPGLSYDITWLIHPDTNEWNHSGGGGAPKVKEYSISNIEPSNTTGSLYFDISETPVQVHSQIPQKWYF